jgi:hypothetical protein
VQRRERKTNEGQRRSADRWPVPAPQLPEAPPPRGQRESRRHADTVEVDSKYLDWTHNVLNLLRTEVLKGKAKFVEHLITDNPTDADSARVRQRLEARCDIDAVAEDVVVVNDDVTDVNADTKGDAISGRDVCIALGHAALYVDRAPHRVDYTRELQQQAIAGGFDDPATIFGNLRVNQLPPMSFQCGQGGAVVAAHEQRIAHHIG